MATWQSFPEDLGEQAWNSLLLQARDYTVFQSYGWGEYKRLASWRPLRYVARARNGDVVGMVQLLLKTLPLGLGIAWAPGGPATRFKGGDLDGADLAGLLAELHERHPRVLVRFQSHIPYDAARAYAFNQTCRRPFFRLISGYSIHIDLAGLEGGLAAQATSKHRYYMKKAAAAPLQWKSGSGDTDIAALTAIHREMVASKNLPSIATSEADVRNLRSALGDDGISILTGYLGERPVTSCMTFNFGAKSIYMVAATGAQGREVSAAYAMIDQLIVLMRARGVEHFDFGGIDPASPAAEGVNHFKRGFGGRIVEYLGEWESAGSEWVRIAMNLAIKKKGGRV